MLSAMKPCGEIQMKTRRDGSMKHKLEQLKNLIGNTPMAEIFYEYCGRKGSVFAKLENFNFSGSIKDRMVYNILAEAFKSGELKQGMKIAEATSGNTGIAFCAQGAYLGIEVTIFMPEWMSNERKQLIKSYGAILREVSKEEGGFSGSVRLADEYAKENGNVFLPHQFTNQNNVLAHYNNTAKEIEAQLKNQGQNLDVFVAGVGTGGTIMGVGNYFKDFYDDVKICPLEPEGCATMKTGYENGEHRIQGIGDGFIPTIVKLDQLDEILVVNDGDAIIMAQKIAKDLGMGVGISSGANLIGTIMAKEIYGEEKIVATVFADDNKKYLSTDLTKVIPTKERFYSNKIKLLGLSIIR